MRRAAMFLVAPLAAERRRWALWLPVAVGSGVALYFSLPREPMAEIGYFTLALGAAWAVVAYHRASSFIAALISTAAALGFVAAQAHTQAVSTVPLGEQVGPAWVQGRVVGAEQVEGGAFRIVLASPQGEADTVALPDRIRIRLLANDPEPALGAMLGVRAVVNPSSGPVVPGAFDFRRHLYFQGIGGIGYAVGHARQLSPPADTGDVWLTALRRNISATIGDAVPDPTVGAIATALLTGEREAVPDAAYEALRDAGLAHLLAISGLHVGLVAGIVFVAVRAGLAAMPRVALRYPIKKWSAAAALMAAFGYTVLVGSPVPTQRAFIMTGLVLLAVLFDRSPLSMRLVACAAAAVLLISPQSVTGPSFQMSFAAVVALVAAYEAVGRSLNRMRRHRAWYTTVLLYLGGVAFTTLIANLATAPFAIYHFHKFASYGLVANLVAVPLTAFWIMPWGVASFLLMPLGLESWSLVPMAWGIDGLLDLARAIAGWTGASIPVPAMPTWGIAAAAMGGLWLCLWERRWRWLGLVAIVVGFSGIALTPRPDVLISEDGRLMAVRQEDGQLTLSSRRRARFVAERWLARNGQRDRPVWPETGVAADGRLNCDPLGCIYRQGEHVVALARDRNALADDCRMADILAVPFWITGQCGATTVVDVDDLALHGAHTIFIEGRDVTIRQATPHPGGRPWMPQR